MFKFLLAVKALYAIFTAPLEPPQIWAEPIPYFLENQMGNYVVPHTERGPGHRGMDFVIVNQQILAPTNGIVSFNDKVVDRNVVTVTSRRYKISFEPACGELKAGTEVLAGEVLGGYCPAESGYEEHCEKCVHMSVRSARGYLNPLLFFGQLTPSKIVG